MLPLPAMGMVVGGVVTGGVVIGGVVVGGVVVDGVVVDGVIVLVVGGGNTFELPRPPPLGASLAQPKRPKAQKAAPTVALRMPIDTSTDTKKDHHRDLYSTCAK